MTLDALIKILIVLFVIDIGLHIYTMYACFIIYKKGVVDATVSIIKGITEASKPKT